MVSYDYIKIEEIKWQYCLRTESDGLEEGFELGLLLGCKLTEGCKRCNDVNKVV